MKFLQKLTQLHLWLKSCSVLRQCAQTTFGTSILRGCTCPHLEILTVSLEGLASNPAAETSATAANFAELCFTLQKRLNQGLTAS